jgi:CheY-like chemotaxis protein
MLGNLVSNATKFSSDGFVRVRAEELGRTAESAVLKFSVQDSGVGVPYEKVRLLFQPFSQVDGTTTRPHGGVGLGLSIVAGLARLMDGDVGVETTPGIGSTFWFLVRVALASAPSPAILPRTAPPPTWPGRRVLVVEDNAINRRVLEVFLARRKLGYVCVENGAEALEALAKEPPFDIVFMDCQMPVMDGFEATRQIRSREAKRSLARLPIIAITAGALPQERARCFDAGMDDFLSKTVELRTLDELLGKWLADPASEQIPA